MPPRRASGRKQPTPRRLKGLARAMEQAGVEWDERRAAEVKREVSRRVQPDPETPPTSRRTADPSRPTTDFFPVPAFLGALLVGGFGYFLGEAALAPYPHPSHWIAAAMAGFLGYVGGFIWHQMRGF